MNALRFEKEGNDTVHVVRVGNKWRRIRMRQNSPVWGQGEAVVSN